MQINLMFGLRKKCSKSLTCINTIWIIFHPSRKQNAQTKGNSQYKSVSRIENNTIQSWQANRCHNANCDDEYTTDDRVRNSG